jgi:hypothetical protein
VLKYRGKGIEVELFGYLWLLSVLNRDEFFEEVIELFRQLLIPLDYSLGIFLDVKYQNVNLLLSEFVHRRFIQDILHIVHHKLAVGLLISKQFLHEFLVLAELIV